MTFRCVNSDRKGFIKSAPEEKPPVHSQFSDVCMYLIPQFFSIFVFSFYRMLPSGSNGLGNCFQSQGRGIRMGEPEQGDQIGRILSWVAAFLNVTSGLHYEAAYSIVKKMY
jgi:hypothetical protein